MAITATTRAEIKHEFYKLTGTASTDGALTEHQTTTDEAVNRYIQYGLWEAQTWFLSNVDPDRWVKTTPTLVFEGSEQTGGRFVPLPSDFLRLYGSDRKSALRQPNGTRWGVGISSQDRSSWGNFWYLSDTFDTTAAEPRLYLGRGATPPGDLVMDYNYYHPVIVNDDTVVDFPALSVLLIAAFSALEASSASWLPGGQEMEAKIDKNLQTQKTASYIRGRRSREPRKVKAGDTIGEKWFVT